MGYVGMAVACPNCKGGGLLKLNTSPCLACKGKGKRGAGKCSVCQGDGLQDYVCWPCLTPASRAFFKIGDQ